MCAIYLISSSSIRLMEDEINKIVKNNPYTSFDLNAISLDDILEEASYFSLFDEKKYMIIKNATIFGSTKKKITDEEKTAKKDEKLINYLEEPNPNTVLIFTLNNKIDSKKKICKIIKEKHKLIQIDDLKPKEIHNKINAYLKEEGYKCDTNLLYYIINNSQNNYDLSLNEIDKIKLYYKKGCQIKEEDVYHIVSHNIEDNNFKFIDTVINKDIKNAFKIYDDFMLQKVEPIMLISMLAKEIRNMLLVKKMVMTKNKKEMMQTLGINYEFQIDKLINNSYSFKENVLENFLILLCDLDYKIKRGKIKSKLALEMFILKVCE